MKKEEKDGYKLCGGEFFPYYIDNNTPQRILDELKYAQIFSENTFANKKLCEKYLKGCCFVYVLQLINVDEIKLYDTKTHINDRFITNIHINKVCEESKIKLTVKYMNREKDSSRH